jgi:hypothetical protein
MNVETYDRDNLGCITFKDSMGRTVPSYIDPKEFENSSIVKELENSENSENSENQESKLNIQIGGSHYKVCKIQPIEYIEANKLSFLEGCVVKRVTRHDKPTGKGKQDIEKAIHELQLLLELRYKNTDNVLSGIERGYSSLESSTKYTL